MLNFDKVEYFAMASGALAAVAVSGGSVTTPALVAGVLGGLFGDIVYKLLLQKTIVIVEDDRPIYLSAVPVASPGEDVHSTQVVGKPSIAHLAPGFGLKYLGNTVSMVSEVDEVEMNAKLR